MANRTLKNRQLASLKKLQAKVKQVQEAIDNKNKLLQKTSNEKVRAILRRQLKNYATEVEEINRTIKVHKQELKTIKDKQKANPDKQERQKQISADEWRDSAKPKSKTKPKLKSEIKTSARQSYIDSYVEDNMKQYDRPIKFKKSKGEVADDKKFKDNLTEKAGKIYDQKEQFDKTRTGAAKAKRAVKEKIEAAKKTANTAKKEANKKAIRAAALDSPGKRALRVGSTAAGIGALGYGLYKYGDGTFDEDISGQDLALLAGAGLGLPAVTAAARGAKKFGQRNKYSKYDNTNYFDKDGNLVDAKGTGKKNLTTKASDMPVTKVQTLPEDIDLSQYDKPTVKRTQKVDMETGEKVPVKSTNVHTKAQTKAIADLQAQKVEWDNIVKEFGLNSEQGVRAVDKLRDINVELEDLRFGEGSYAEPTKGQKFKDFVDAPLSGKVDSILDAAGNKIKNVNDVLKGLDENTRAALKSVYDKAISSKATATEAVKQMIDSAEDSVKKQFFDSDVPKTETPKAETTKRRSPFEWWKDASKARAAKAATKGATSETPTGDVDLKGPRPDGVSRTEWARMRDSKNPLAKSRITNNMLTNNKFSRGSMTIAKGAAPITLASMAANIAAEMSDRPGGKGATAKEIGGSMYDSFEKYKNDRMAQARDEGIRSALGTSVYDLGASTLEELRDAPANLGLGLSNVNKIHNTGDTSSVMEYAPQYDENSALNAMGLGQYNTDNYQFDERSQREHIMNTYDLDPSNPDDSALIDYYMQQNYEAPNMENLNTPPVEELDQATNWTDPGVTSPVQETSQDATPKSVQAPVRPAATEGDSAYDTYRQTAEPPAQDEAYNQQMADQYGATYEGTRGSTPIFRVGNSFSDTASGAAWEQGPDQTRRAKQIKQLNQQRYGNNLQNDINMLTPEQRVSRFDTNQAAQQKAILDRYAQKPTVSPMAYAQLTPEQQQLTDSVATGGMTNPAEVMEATQRTARRLGQTYGNPEFTFAPDWARSTPDMSINDWMDWNLRDRSALAKPELSRYDPNKGIWHSPTGRSVQVAPKDAMDFGKTYLRPTADWLKNSQRKRVE